MKKATALILVLWCFYSCEEKKEILTAQQIVDNAIEASGSQLLDSSKVEFDFRNIHYTSIRKPGYYRYTRTQTDSLGNVITDAIGSDGFSRRINDTLVQVHDTMANKYSNSVNSVHYFAYLPYNLNDKAVHKKDLGEVTIKGVKYHKIQVTFSENGGGDDHEDVFLYWFRNDGFQMDYLAYLYHTDGGGIRFREAFNSRKVNGVTFLDYHNLKPEEDYQQVDFLKIDSLYNAGKLTLLSDIILENVAVQPYKEY